MLGFTELLEFLETRPEAELRAAGGQPAATLRRVLMRAAVDTCEHYICDVAAADGVPYWDDGAPELHRLGDWRARPADPFNDWEPVDASAAAVAAQGLLRLGHLLGARRGARYFQAGLTVAHTLLDAPYLALQRSHQGLLLHSVYHWPNRWDHVPAGRRVTCGEAGMWGDYHLLELALLVRQLASGGRYPTFFGFIEKGADGLN